jgi:hypothetical protein
MKMTIEWHEECLKNMRINSEREMVCARNQMERAERFILDTVIYAAQIELAKHKKKTAFDREKFGRNKINAETNTQS